MLISANSLSSFHIRPLGPIKNEQWQEGRAHEARAPEEERSELRILTFTAIRGVKEPDGGIDANA